MHYSHFAAQKVKENVLNTDEDGTISEETLPCTMVQSTLYYGTPPCTMVQGNAQLC